MPVKKKTAGSSLSRPEKVKTRKPGKLRVAALKATRAANRPRDFLGLTGAATTPGAWTSPTEGNPKSVWTGSVWTNAPKGPKDSRNRGYPSSYTPGDWAQGGSGITTPKPAFRPPPSVGIKNYQTPTPYKPFKEASTLLGQLYDIARGVDPGTGNQLTPYGTPGTLSAFGHDSSSPIYEAIDAGRSSMYPTRFGNTADIPSGYTVRAPNIPRPRWLEWYEEINEPQWLQWSK